MRQLKADEEIARGPVLFSCRDNELLEAREVGVGDEQLTRVRARVGIDRDRLAPEHLRAAVSESRPAADRQLSRRPLERAVAPLHRVDRPTVANRLGADLQGLARLAAVALEPHGEVEGVDLRFERTPVAEKVMTGHLKFLPFSPSPV